MESLGNSEKFVLSI